MVTIENVQNYTFNSSSVMFGSFGIMFYDDEFGGNFVDTTTHSIKITISVLISIAMFISIFGNICICTVIMQNRSMRTPTNCYLANLAITDLLISLFIPIDLYIIWMPDFYPLGDVGCRLHFFLLDCFSNCNLLTITAFTIERYVVVTKPFLRQKLMRNSRVFKIMAVIWVLSLMFGLPDIVYMDLLERKKYVFCYFTTAFVPNWLIGLHIVIFFVLPLTIIVVLYILIIIELKPENEKLRQSLGNTKQNRDKVVKLIAAIASSFFFFWSPFCMLRVMMIYPNFKYEDNSTLWKIVNYLCYNCYMSTAVNPILYSLISRKFRQAFKDILKGRRSSHRRDRNSRLLYHCKLEQAVIICANTES